MTLKLSPLHGVESLLQTFKFVIITSPFRGADHPIGRGSSDHCHSIHHLKYIFQSRILNLSVSQEILHILNFMLFSFTQAA